MNNALALNALPRIDDAKLPIVYERATQALAECSRIDECKEWANKAEAIASYARQSRDETLRKMAERIQARAIRRCGELLKKIDTQPGKRTDLEPSEGSLTRSEVANEAGLSRHQKVTALRVASVLAIEFERAVESDKPPTVTKLAELGKLSKPQPLHDLGGIDPRHYARATELRGHLQRLVEFCKNNEPQDIASAYKQHEIEGIKQSVSQVEAWSESKMDKLRHIGQELEWIKFCKRF